MGKAHSSDLRSRVIAFVDEGHSHRAAARHFRVSPRFVNDLVILRRETGGLEPRLQGRRKGAGKLGEHLDWLKEYVLSTNGKPTLEELRAALAGRGAQVTTPSVWRALRRLGFTHKKNRFAHRTEQAGCPPTA